MKIKELRELLNDIEDIYDDNEVLILDNYSEFAFELDEVNIDRYKISHITNSGTIYYNWMYDDFYQTEIEEGEDLDGWNPTIIFKAKEMF